MCLLAQTAGLKGTVADETGAVVPGIKVTLNGATSKTVVTANDGTYSITGLPAGNYTVQVTAPDLALSAPVKLNLKGGVQTLNLQLKVASVSQQVTVSEAAGSTITPEPANNASALVLRGDDLQALSDDPTDLESDLQALAGPAAGPNGGAIYIDGFSGGQLPSKDSIREIRINSNPFSPEYEKLGLGRIEIFTKPGSDKYRGAAFYNFSDDFWNSRNPYSADKAPFLLKEYGGNLGGPLGKRSSFFVDVRRDATDNGAIINAITLDPTTGRPTPFDGVYNIEQRSIRVSPRFDYQLNTNNTLTARYAFSDVDIPGAGVGSFSLQSRGYDAKTRSQTVQMSETAVLGPSTINEVRFQFFRVDYQSIPFNDAPSINVLGSFNGGGSPVGRTTSVTNSYELQEYVSRSRGAHSLKFGARLRGQTVDDVSRQNFNGTFTFGGTTGVSSIEQYRLGQPTQFSIATGTPGVSAGQFDLGAFVNDDWRVRPNVTLSLGLRYETQTNIHDWRDLAPRIGIAYAPRGGLKGAKAKTVVRAGFGMFYDRFALAGTLTGLRYNGLLQQQYVVQNPGFYPTIPSLASLGGVASQQILERVASDLRAPYIMQSAISVERQLPFSTTVAVTYANSHGLHMLRSRVLGGPIYLMESSGIYNQNQLIVNVNTKVNSAFSLFSSYMLNKAMSDTDGLGTYPANPSSYAGEYGPAATDIRNRASVGGSLLMRGNFRISPFVVLESGPPFDITIGRDLYGTTLFNARPGIATDPARPGLIATSYGLLDPNPIPGETILSRNYGRGPGSILVNLRVAKTFGFGHGKESKGDSAGNITGPPGAGGGGGNRGGGSPFGGGNIQSLLGATPTPRPYNLIVSMQVRNIINHNNPGAIVGNITSPIFGQANQPAGAREAGGGGFTESANNRRLELQLRFTF